jgi:hypothetical protein
MLGQETVSTTGGEASGTGGTVSYTVGQVLYNTHSSGTNSEAQGVQQPYEISIVVGIKEQEGISLHCQVYPNPSTSYLMLNVESSELFDDLNYQLYDVTGKLLKSDSVNGNTTRIGMEDYVPAIYMLRVVSKNQLLQTFKIIKN